MNDPAIRDVAELYYARFEARLEKGLAELRSELAKSAHLRSRTAGPHAHGDDLASAMRKDTRDLVQCMFAAWLATVVYLGALLVAFFGR